MGLPMSDKDFETNGLAGVDDIYFERMKAFKEAKFRLGLRGALTVVALLVGAYFIYISLSEVGYYQRKGTTPVALGDVRSDKFEPDVIGVLNTNDYIKFENDIIMFDELKSEEYSFYFSPVTNFVVRTKQEMPDKDTFRLRDSVIELNVWEATMVASKKVFPWDLKVSISGEGRVIDMEDAPKWAGAVASFMSNSSGVPMEEMHIFLDGEAPESYAVFFYMIIGAAVLMAVTVAFFLDAMVRYLRTRKAAGTLPW